MKRFAWSIAILVSLIISCIWSLNVLRVQCRWYGGLTERTIQAAQEGRTAQALASLDEMLDNWDEFHNTTGLFIDGGKLDAIHERLIDVAPLLANGDADALSELTAARELIDGLYEEELPIFWHIL